MATLYSYCIPYDDGAAPNPYWGICTLAICKPRIRSVAKVGDWIVGTGSKKVKPIDLSNKVIYAMRVTEKMSIKDYFNWAIDSCPEKIPDFGNKDIRRKLGDAIYDYTSGKPIQLSSVHNEKNINTDLSGHNVLLSREFYYFGNNAILLPDYLLPIVNQQQNHKSRLNKPFVEKFINWIEGCGFEANKLHGEPGMELFDDIGTCIGCSKRLEDYKNEC